MYAPRSQEQSTFQWDQSDLHHAARISLVTANVLTLQPAEEKVETGLMVAGRRLDLADQFACEGADFVGLQETRTRSLASPHCGGYFVVAAPATEQGNLGGRALDS